MILKVNDRIKMIKDFDAAKKGMTGTIKKIDDDSYAVEFDKAFEGAHSCGGSCRYDYGQWVNKSHMTLLSKNKIIIESNGEVTTAKLIENGKTIKTSTATCSSDDEFDLFTGAELAISRLKKESLKFKIGDIVIGNDIADKAYAITKKGWRGVVVAVKNDSFYAHEAGSTNDMAWELDYNHFDLCE